MKVTLILTTTILLIMFSSIDKENTKKENQYILKIKKWLNQINLILLL